MKAAIILMLAMLAFMSLFTPITINGQAGFPFQIDFIEGPKLFMRKDIPYDLRSDTAMILLFIIHLILIAFPLTYQKLRRFDLWLSIVPAIFLIVIFNFYGPFIFIFIPFAIVWIYQYRKFQRVSAGNQSN